MTGRQKTLDSIEQCLRRLRTLEKLVVFRSPAFKLNPFPARRQVLLEYRQCVLQLATTEHIDVEIAPAVRVWAEDPSAEQSLHVLQWLEIATMHTDLERRLLPVAGE